MPHLYEIFGYPISDQSDAARAARRDAHCAFMNAECDGGGNRDLSTIDLAKNPRMQRIFPAKTQVCAGVCSIQMTPETSPWIVCPRRLLALNRGTNESLVQRASEHRVFRLLDYPVGTRLGVWSEVKVIYAGEVDGVSKKFNATFDYIVMPLVSIPAELASDRLSKNWAVLKRELAMAGYSFSFRNGSEFVEDFPAGTPSIIEIMTSSTSGGNKKHRSAIPMAFEDAMLGIDHRAPGINFRQVWARMVSQLIVKSEVGIGWGGKTLWLMQDHLLNYMSASTALKLKEFASEHTSEVNLLSFAYENNFHETEGIRELSATQLYSGPIARSSSATEQTHSFQDILKSPILPPKQHLVNLLARRRRSITVTV